MMIASLMMYARPEHEDAMARFWALIREQLQAQGVESPTQLSQQADVFDVWNDPSLVLSQTCGMPYRIWLKDNVQLVGTIDYGLKDCPAGYYRSPFVVRRDDPRNALVDFKTARFAFNQTHSQSGFAGPYEHTKQQGFWFETCVASGGHLASAQAVADGRADIAALDGVTWRLIKQYEPSAEKLRVLEWTYPTPGLPLITAATQDAQTLFSCVSTAIERLSSEDKNRLGIQTLIKIPEEAYLAVPNPPSDLMKLG